jgi:hypothetical protein
MFIRLTLSSLVICSPDSFSPSFFIIMTRTLALGMLRQGQNGEQILSILETLVSELNEEKSENLPTSQPIQF